MLKHALFSKKAYVKHCPGHRNSKGDLAEWCIYSHETGKILSSHKSQGAAKSHLQDMHAHSGSARKRAYGYFNYEWQGNDALLFGPEKQTVLLSGKAARAFELEMERLENEIPHDEALELAVNDYIKSFFKNWTEPE